MISGYAYAIIDFDPGDLSSITDPIVKSLIQTTSVGLDHRAYSSATALPAVVGVDIGVDVTVVKTPIEFKEAITAVTQEASNSVPDVIPVPRINVHKGLGLGLELGGSLINYQGLIKIYGLDLKWMFLSGSLTTPSIAIRGSACFATLWFIKSHTYKVDLLVSKRLAFIDPYVGVGVQTWSGRLSIPGLPVSGENSSTSPHFFAGLPIKIFILKLVAELDYNTIGLTTYGGKVSLSF